MLGLARRNLPCVPLIVVHRLNASVVVAPTAEGKIVGRLAGRGFRDCIQVLGGWQRRQRFGNSKVAGERLVDCSGLPADDGVAAKRFLVSFVDSFEVNQSLSPVGHLGVVGAVAVPAP